MTRTSFNSLRFPWEGPPCESIGWQYSYSYRVKHRQSHLYQICMVFSLNKWWLEGKKHGLENFLIKFPMSWHIIWSQKLPFSGFRDHGEGREDREAGPGDAHHEDLQACQTLCRSPVAHLHAQSGEDAENLSSLEVKYSYVMHSLFLVKTWSAFHYSYNYSKYRKLWLP